MYRLFVLANDGSRCFGKRALVSLSLLMLFAGINPSAQSTVPPSNARAPFSLRATHLLGLENTKNNCKGILSIQDDGLRFQKCGTPEAQVNIASVRALFLGEESKQVGGVPMKVGKAAAPYGGGHVVSLFAHKKYDTLALEYVDADGGIHGAIFQVTKGQGELVRSELQARGLPSGFAKDEPTKQATAEVTHEHK